MASPRERSIGRYELLIELARGGMAELFLGRLHGAGGFAKLVAIKRILPHLAEDKQFTEMFLNEGRIAARLAHPNVCQVFELDEVDGELFLAMEYLDGVSWEHLLAAIPRGAPAMRLAAGVLAQAADGLHYAHTLRDVDGRPTPVVHRDVSPQNLFVTVDGVCKVLDFGVSKMATDGPRTRSGVVKGKLPYMAPEQIRGEAVDARADVFSLGVCAWEAFAGVRLFDRETDFLIWKAITEEDAPPITAHWPGCPPALDAAVQRALDRDPGRRQATARELADDLRGHAGMASPGEIADAVRTGCGDQLAARANRIASAVSERRAATDPGASDTLIERAGETLPSQAGVQLRGASIAVKRPRNGKARRGQLATALAAAAVAAIVTAVIVVIVLGRRVDGRAAPAPDAKIVDEPSTVLPGLGGLGKLKRELTQLRDTLEPLRDGVLPAPGYYNVDSRPRATIYADDVDLGETPLRARLPAGKHAIRAVLADGREQTFSIEVVAGEDVSSEKLAW